MTIKSNHEKILKKESKLLEVMENLEQLENDLKGKSYDFEVRSKEIKQLQSKLHGLRLSCNKIRRNHTEFTLMELITIKKSEIYKSNISAH